MTSEPHDMARDAAEPSVAEPARRRFVQSASGLLLAGSSALAPSRAASLGRVVVVGGGFGGATAARYLRYWGGAGMEVVLVERDREFISCPLSNLVLAGARRIEDLTRSYDGLKKAGVHVITDEVTSIDAATRQVRLASGQTLTADRVIVSPGVDLNYDEVEGFTAAARERIVPAWKAGEQTVRLRRQLEAMRDGGVCVLTVPLAPYRCPPGPYERACQIAWYFRQHKPRSKVIVLDANPEITSKKVLFSRAFAETYKGLIEYRPNSNVTEVDATDLVATTEVGDSVRADVLSILPPQSAAVIARRTGLINANNRWCQIDWRTMESTAAPGIHVLGDATLAAPAMPKSGHMANQHGKTAAAAIVEIFNGRKPADPMMTNTCYSLLDDRTAVHVASVHRYSERHATMETVPGSGGLSPTPSEAEGDYAIRWAHSIWRDMLG